MTRRKLPAAQRCSGAAALALSALAVVVPAAERYSYVFGGDAEALDHVLTTRAADPWVATVAVSRGNADAPQALDTDPSTAAGSSDHDGLVVYLGPHVRRPEGRRPLP